MLTLQNKAVIQGLKKENKLEEMKNYIAERYTTKKSNPPQLAIYVKRFDVLKKR